MNPIDTGRFIRIQRKKLNLSQSKLAEMLCVEPQTVSKWERGLGMPDYDNVDKLREIFGCTLSEILEPDFDEPEETRVEEIAEEKEQVTNLPILVEIIDDKDEKTDKKKQFQFFDFLNKKKIKAMLEKMFGYEYANTYNEKFLFKNVFKKRSREEYETTLTQGMFRNKISHNVIGIEAPWLYMRLFFFMLLCTGVAFVLAIVGSPMPFVMVGGLCSALPLMMFLFESNFARNLSIVDVLKMFAIGGLGSIVLTLFLRISSNNDIVNTIVVAPIFEEICKAIMVVIFVAKIKPTNMLTGLLIGFSVGSGFSFFENVMYGFDNYIYALLVSGDEIVASSVSIGNIVARTASDFLMGHHYWTGLFGAIYVLFKKKANFDIKELFQWRVMLALLFSMSLHAMWNGAASMDIPVLPVIMQLFVYALSVGSLIVLINVGIAQTRILGIWEDYQSEHKEELLVKEATVNSEN